MESSEEVQKDVEAVPLSFLAQKLIQLQLVPFFTFMMPGFLLTL